MWHKAEWIGLLMRLELTRVGLLVKFVNRYTTKGAPSYIRFTLHDSKLNLVNITLSNTMLRLIWWPILTACQLLSGYFMPREYRISYIVHSYLHFYVIDSWKFFFFTNASIWCKWFLNSYIWLLDRTLADSTTLCNKGSGSNCNEEGLFRCYIYIYIYMRVCVYIFSFFLWGESYPPPP